MSTPLKGILLTTLTTAAFFSAVNAFAGTTAATTAVSRPAAVWLAEHYGISFSGFKTPIPAASAPDLSGNTYVRVAILQRVFVSDGFRHAAMINQVTKKAWILRTGGFVSVCEWYGPVEADTTSLNSCLTQTDRSPLRAQKAG